MDLLPTELSDYVIKLNNQDDILMCELEYGSKLFYSQITLTDLKSGLVSLSKLSNIIKSNCKQIQPGFTIWFESVKVERSDSNYLVLNIIFSGPKKYIKLKKFNYFLPWFMNKPRF
jgi:hypothetical protein